MRPSFDKIFMDFAVALSERSTCLRAKVGCVIVTKDSDKILSMGYNGGARGMENHCDSNEVGNCGCLHAEDNCLIKMNYNDAASKKMYITTSPCIICSKRILNARIDEVIYLTEYRKTEGIDLLTRGGVTIRRFEERNLQIKEDIAS